MQIKLRKVLAIIACLAMLCTVLPLSALMSVAAEETPVFSADFNDGTNPFDNGSVVAAGSDGSNCLQWECTSSWGATTVTIDGIEQNTDYTVTFKMKADNTNYVNLTFQDTSWYSNNYFGVSVTPTAEWKEYSVTTDAGRYCKNGSIYFKFQSSAAQTFWIDDITIVKVVSEEPEQPDEPVEPGEEEEYDNLVVNGDFEDGLTGWSGSGATRSIVTDDVHGGSNALKMSNITGQYGSGAVSGAIAVKANTTYVIKWWAKRLDGDKVFNLYIDGSYKSVSGKNWMTSGDGSGWVEYTWVITPTVNSIKLKFSTEVEGGNPGTILLDDIMMYEKPAITNGGFETGDTEGWTVYNGSTVTTENPHSGTYSLHAYGNSWAGIAYQDIPVTNGRTYELSFWYYNNVGFNYKIVGQTSGTEYAATWKSNTGEWTQVKHEFLATDESMIRLNFSGLSADTSPDFFLDDVQIKEIKDPSNDGYIKNGDFETGTNVGWTVYQSTTVNKAAAKDGDYGMEVHGNGGWGGALKQAFNLQANRDYILRFDAKAVSQGFNIKITDDLAVAGGESNARLWGIYFATTEWTSYEITFNSGENTTAALQFVGSGINQNGDKADDIVYLDNVSIEKVGGEDPIPNNNLTGGQTSVKDVIDSVKGLAFRFQVDGVGAEIDDTNAYVAGSADVKLYKDRDDMYKLVKAGAIVTNVMSVGKGDMTLDSVDGKKTINIDAKYLIDVAADSFAYAVRILNIPEANLGTNIFARPYYVYEDADGNEQIIYGNTKSENYSHAADPYASIKILAIGNSFSQDAMNNHLYEVLESAGYKEIILGNMYIGGCSLDTHWSNMKNDTVAYTYYYRDATTNGWRKSASDGAKLSEAMNEVEWDYITIQQVSGSSGNPSDFGNLDNCLNWIDENKTNPNAKILWHMTWAYDETATNSSFSKYNKDQMTMYRKILDTTNEKVLSHGLVDGVIPSGTAIQNMRTSALLDDDAILHETDGYHLSANVGDYIAALTWYAYLSGDDVSGVAYQPDAVADFRSDINASVNAAVENPYKVTKCETYDTTKSIKVLSIGHSFSVDVMGTYLYDMLEQAGYEDITIGYLYYPGCSLSRHWEYISTNTNGHERYGENKTGSWETTSTPYPLDVLRNEDWDYVTLQASPDYVGGQNNEYSYIPGIIDWIQENALNANVDVKWHQIWAYSEGCGLWSYQYHNFDQLTMYNNIINATNQYITTNEDITGIIPVGTAVQNARALLGDIFNELDESQGGSDGYHLNNKYGDFLGSLTWACYFSGVDAHTITERSSGMTEEEFDAIADAVNAALADWTQVTVG